jgi:hypothetical protein
VIGIARLPRLRERVERAVLDLHFARLRDD